MPFHISNFGKFDRYLKKYADIEGYVPERGDMASDFNYPEPNDFHDQEIWQEFVAEAVQCAESAQRDVDEWREGQQ